MTREQIEYIKQRHEMRAPIDRTDVDVLLAAAERALVLEEVLVAARVVLSDIDDAWLFGSNIKKLRAAIDRAEGR